MVLSLSHVVSWVRCGTLLYQFLIFAIFLALDITHMQLQNIAINNFYECNFSLVPFMFYPDKEGYVCQFVEF